MGFSRLVLLSLSATLAFTACADPVRRFALRDPVWVDPDRNHVPEKPAKYFSGLRADGADNILFRPMSKWTYLPLEEEAWNVNSVDEVPNSAWFQNRIGLHPMSPEEVARGACGDVPPLDPAKGPWLVTSGKPDGANPGFFIKAPDGNRYLLKFDSDKQPQRATTADVVGSKLYHAFGFFTPCNEIVYFKSDVLEIAPDADKTNEYGDEVPLTRDDVNRILTMAFRLKDGTLRASASRFLPGTPLGPWRYEDTREDDPNDIIPHQYRRELRGGRLLAAWIQHFDSREQNTLDLWVSEGGRDFIRHYYLDFGDSFGSLWDWDALARRIGHSGYLDFEHVFADFLTLGMLWRPWNHVYIGPEVETFGYFGAENFVGSQWRPGYGNPAFEEMTDTDAAWAVRILSRFTDAHVRAAVETGRMTVPRAHEYLVSTLIARRDQILREYLGRLSPLDRFVIVRREPGNPVQSLCFEDLAIRTAVVAGESTFYRIRFHGGRKLERMLGWLNFRPDPEHPHRSCVQLPVGPTRPADLAGDGARDDDPLRYGVLELLSNQTPSAKATASIRLHVYDLGPERGYRLVGIDRVARATAPLY